MTAVPKPDARRNARPGFAYRAGKACNSDNAELFFPKPGPQSSQPALRLCRARSLRRPCLAFAIRTDQRHGIWGGMTPDQRRKLVARGPA